MLNVKDLQLSVDQKSVCDRKKKYNPLPPDRSVPDAQLVCTKQHDMPSFYVPYPLSHIVQRDMSLPGKSILLYACVFSYSDIRKGNCHLAVAPYTTFNAKGFEDS